MTYKWKNKKKKPKYKIDLIFSSVNTHFRNANNLFLFKNFYLLQQINAKMYSSFKEFNKPCIKNLIIIFSIFSFLAFSILHCIF